MHLLRISLALWVCILAGCSTSSGLQQARVEFASGAPMQALNTLESTNVSERDRLLLLLDKGAIAFSAGQYTRAKDALLSANDLIEEWDQIRVGEESASLVTNEWAKRYRGEYSEQLWLHSYLMMLFLIQDEPESAAVEARRALQRLDAHTKPLQQDWFTRALIALSFEAAGAHDSAQVEYRKLINDSSYDGRWNNVIARHTKRLGRDPIIGVSSTASNTLRTANQLGLDEGELVVFLQTGRIAKKLPGDLTLDIDLRIAFPLYADYPEAPPRYRVISDGESVPYDDIDTRLLNVAKSALSARGKSIATKQIARIVAKKALVDAASNEDELLGGIIQILVFATEQADTRSWETLPGWFSMVRVPLPVGKQNVTLELDYRGNKHRVDLGEVDIKAGRLHFANFRTDQPLPLPDGAPLEAPGVPGSTINPELPLTTPNSQPGNTPSAAPESAPEPISPVTVNSVPAS